MVSHAQVIRCVDAAGSVSYTDDKACPPGTRQNGQVQGEVATVRRPAPAADSTPLVSPVPRDAIGAPVPVPVPAPSPGGGLSVIDPRANQQPASDPRVNDRRAGDWGDVVIDDGSYGPYPGGYRRARPPRDMRPPLRSCDASGCRDTLGNQYDRSGRVTGYQRPDGSSCRQVGTTQVCR